jgi:retron-type reverse transcriptase
MPMRTTDKPFKIDKRLVYEAYKAVKSNAGAAGVDGETIEQFEADLQNNLYKLWRAEDFSCAHRGGSRGSNGRQTAH